MMTLREVCNELGVSRRAVQGYEKAGLVSPSGHNKYGYLLYDAAAVEQIRQIKQYQAFGFTLKEISRLINAPDEIYVQMLSCKIETMKNQMYKLEMNIQKAEHLLEEKR